VSETCLIGVKWRFTRSYAQVKAMQELDWR